MGDNSQSRELHVDFDVMHIMLRYESGKIVPVNMWNWHTELKKNKLYFKICMV